MFQRVKDALLLLLIFSNIASASPVQRPSDDFPPCSVNASGGAVVMDAGINANDRLYCDYANDQTGRYDLSALCVASSGWVIYGARITRSGALRCVGPRIVDS